MHVAGESRAVKQRLYKHMTDFGKWSRYPLPRCDEMAEEAMQTASVNEGSASDFARVSGALSALSRVSLHEKSISAAGTALTITSLETAIPDANAFAARMHNMAHAVSALLNAVNCALSGESETAREYVTAAFRSLEPLPDSSGPEVSSAQDTSAKKCRGGLAPWQIRRVSTHIEEHLSGAILCEDLARLVDLSLSHFTRAFRDSFGCPPHTYLMKRRVERAQGLMLTTDTALGHIALECGLADQSHLSRLFQRFSGESPGAWRRARINAIAP